MEADAREEVLSLMRNMEVQQLHVTHVTRLALELFDGLVPLHGYGPHERFLLEAAGFLHDIGHAMEEENGSHHKESARLIREHVWKEVPLQDVEIIAQIARYHRRATPELKHNEFAVLPEYERRIVKTQAAILRIADSLDRNHEQYIEHLLVAITPQQLTITLQTQGPYLREALSAYRKGDLAEEVFNRQLVFMVGEQVIKREDSEQLNYE
jgi:exopolyphosphatase / guanosine-5'-triphosphate,3'-diphosphate pyrophosphatase